MDKTKKWADSLAKEVLTGTGEGHYKKVKEHLAKKIALARRMDEED